MRRTPTCIYGCPGPAHPYPQGWRCTTHGPPAQPTPPAGTTAAERRQRGPHTMRPTSTTEATK
jgi:hypothetical protein